MKFVEKNVTKAKKISEIKRERLSKKGKEFIFGCCFSVLPGMFASVVQRSFR